MKVPLFSPKLRQAAALTAGLFTFPIVAAHADEGTWLYNDPPKAQIQRTYGVTLTDA